MKNLKQMAPTFIILCIWSTLTVAAGFNLVFAERPLLSPVSVMLMFGLLLVLISTSIAVYPNIRVQNAGRSGE